MCVTQLNCIEIKGNYGAPVRSYLHLAISNLLFQVLLTLTKARQWLAGRDNNILDNERQLILSIDTQSQRARIQLELCSIRFILSGFVSKLIHQSQI